VRVVVHSFREDTPYNYETGVDLREQMTMCDVGDVFTIPANIEKTFDQISNAVAYVSASGAVPEINKGWRSFHWVLNRPRVCQPLGFNPLILLDWCREKKQRIMSPGIC